MDIFDNDEMREMAIIVYMYPNASILSGPKHWNWDTIHQQLCYVTDLLITHHKYGTATCAVEYRNVGKLLEVVFRFPDDMRLLGFSPVNYILVSDLKNKHNTKSIQAFRESLIKPNFLGQRDLRGTRMTQIDNRSLFQVTHRLASRNSPPRARTPIFTNPHGASKQGKWSFADIGFFDSKAQPEPEPEPEPEINKNLYDILNIPPHADKKTIQKAYRQLAKQYYPDMPTGDKEKFLIIQRAYETLSDPMKRKRYDAALRFLTASAPKLPF